MSTNLRKKPNSKLILHKRYKYDRYSKSTFSDTMKLILLICRQKHIYIKKYNEEEEIY